MAPCSRKVFTSVATDESLLTDGYINTVHRVSGQEILTLVDDGIDGNGGLTYLTVADNQLTLSATYGHHGINSLDTCLQRLVYRLTKDYSGSLPVERQRYRVAGNRTGSVDRIAQCIDDTAYKSVAYGNRCDFPGTAHSHVLLDSIAVGTHQDDSDIALFKVHGHTAHTVFKLDQLT